MSMGNRLIFVHISMTKVISDHEDFLVKVARQLNDADGTFSALMQVLTSIYKLIFQLQIAFFRIVRTGKWRILFRGKALYVNSYRDEIMRLNDAARKLEQTMAQSAIGPPSFGEGLNDMAKNLEVVAADSRFSRNISFKPFSLLAQSKRRSKHVPFLDYSPSARDQPPDTVECQWPESC